ncbi:recombinase family protein [Deinococcus roseus]|uniref:Resolvase n=1 Tax=Deinococcus roseus TaxID=392414 RepID=A0ABQ2DHE1_9DEIO|nr:recombinase family protein [Deinococcus roseus]GGJ57730.1 resolvase [Deinococcus roseus]
MKNAMVGYARVSTRDQNLNLQIDALTKEGCVKIFKDTSSGAKTDRPGFAEALNYLREGDTLVVWKLDRLGRSLKNLIDTVQQLQSRGIHLLIVKERIDTSTSNGKLFLHIFGALSEFERELIRERTKAGLEAARARNRVGGRPEKLLPNQEVILKKLHADPSNSPKAIQEMLGISKTTYYRYLKKQKPV